MVSFRQKLFEVDQVHFLLDCGWDERFDMTYIEAVKRRVPQINAVLLSYADIPHIGALPYLVRKCGLNCPVYATVGFFRYYIVILPLLFAIIYIFSVTLLIVFFFGKYFFKNFNCS